MKIRNWVAGCFVAGVLAFAGQAAHASVICSGCEYGGGAGTYLGAYDPENADFGTFQHSDVGQDAGPRTAFEDFWVFDLAADGDGSISADFTMFAAISGFAGELYRDAGSTCAGDECSSVMLGALVANGMDTERRWEVMAMGLTAGRYVLRVIGTTNAISNSNYTGQLGFDVGPGTGIAEPGTAALFGLGLLGMGLRRRRRL
jgi:hypothetical protein